MSQENSSLIKFTPTLPFPTNTIPTCYVECQDENSNEYEYQEYPPHIFEIAKKAAVKRKIMRELKSWLVSHDTMMNCYENDHEGWQRFPLRRKSTPEDMEYMDQITSSSYLDEIFEKNKDYFFVDDWRDLISVKSVPSPREDCNVYVESFGKSAERLNDHDPQQFYIKTLESISESRCYNFFSIPKPSVLTYF
uniref:Enhancer of polycomb-like protein n=1 Tax=Strongyloides papillosus TaxID=174720 RepID=A0A0N5BK62_STREA